MDTNSSTDVKTVGVDTLQNELNSQWFLFTKLTKQDLARTKDSNYLL